MTCAGASAVVVADGSPGFCIDEGRSFSTNRNDRVCHQPRLGGGLPGRFSGNLHRCTNRNYPRAHIRPHEAVHRTAARYDKAALLLT
jgi:hypothetical protein